MILRCYKIGYDLQEYVIVAWAYPNVIYDYGMAISIDIWTSTLLVEFGGRNSALLTNVPTLLL